MHARIAAKSSPESVRPCRQIGSTAHSFYENARSESSKKCPNSRRRLTSAATVSQALRRMSKQNSVSW